MASAITIRKVHFMNTFISSDTRELCGHSLSEVVKLRQRLENDYLSLHTTRERENLHGVTFDPNNYVDRDKLQVLSVESREGIKDVRVDWHTFERRWIYQPGTGVITLSVYGDGNKICRLLIYRNNRIVCPMG
jgi:hypothetical protein